MKLAVITLAAILVGLAVPGAASAAGHADSANQIAAGWTDSAKPNKAFPQDYETHLPLGTWSDEAGVSHTSRIYATFDLSKYEGKEVSGGTVYIQENSAADCTKRSIELWQTRAVASLPTWNRAPEELTKLDDIQTSDYCPRASISFDASAAVAAAVAAKQRLLTLELRVSAEHEADPAYGRRLNWYRGVSLGLSYNTIPKIDGSYMYNGGFGCTQLKPYPTLGGFAGTLQAVVVDPDDNEQLTTEYSIWPTGAPESAVSHTASYGTSGRVSGVNIPSARLVHGTSYAWKARVSDRSDTSAWSKKCFFTYDGLAPTAPLITSPNFPPGATGPAGQTPTFVLDGHRDKDIAGFEYSYNGLGVQTCATPGDHGQLVCEDPFSLSGTIRADMPGGKATVTVNPDRSGPTELTVRAIDTAGNRSPRTVYSFDLPHSDPTIEVEGDAPEWNKDVVLKLSPARGVTGVTGYEIKRQGEDRTETISADEDGVARFGFRAYEQYGPYFTVRSISENGFRSAPATWSTYFWQRPGVESEQYPKDSPDPTGGVGVEGTFVFSPPPGWYEVKEYRYSIDDVELLIAPAGPDGTATITWTPETDGYHYVTVTAIKPDGTENELSHYYDFRVAGS